MPDDEDNDGASQGQKPGSADGDADKKAKESEERIKKLEEDNKKLQEERADIERQRDGVYGRMRGAEERLKEIEAKIKSNGDQDVIDLGVEEEEYVSGKQLRTILPKIEGRFQKQLEARDKKHFADRIEERKADDELRLTETLNSDPEKYPVSYDDALKAFKALADRDPTLWHEVNRRAARAGGRPAKFAYEYALREDPELAKIGKKKDRESLLEEIERAGNNPRTLRSSGTGGGRRAENLPDKDFYEMSEEELDRLAEQT